VERFAESNSAIQQIENLRYRKSSRRAAIPGNTDRLEVICATPSWVCHRMKHAGQWISAPKEPCNFFDGAGLMRFIATCWF